MKISLMSDLHLEFHSEGGIYFIKNLNLTDVDVLVLAGDITVNPFLETTLKTFADECENVVFVPGNHEYYNSSKELVNRTKERVLDKYDNIHWLDRSSVDINGTVFHGGTLWYPWSSSVRSAISNSSDFVYIKDLENWAFLEGADTADYLRNNISSGDIVVTHMLPTTLSIDPKFQGYHSNCLFLHDCSDIIEETEPAYWFHGHTHTSCDYVFHKTRVMCNPYGYLGLELNPCYKPRLIVEI